MILTDYYKFSKVATKAKGRFDCVASTQSYEEFECRRTRKEQKETAKRDGYKLGALLCYYGNRPEKFGGAKTDKSLTMGSSNVTSIYVPDVTSNVGYGDVKETSDAVLFVVEVTETSNGVEQGSTLEVFVARGQRNNKQNLYSMFVDGLLDDEAATLRERAKEE